MRDSTLKVAIDVAGVVRRDTGVGQYTDGLVRALDATAPDVELTAFCNAWRWPSPDSVRALPARVVNPHLPDRILRRFWARFGWPAVEMFTGPIDVFHASDWVTPPVRQAAMVATILDVGPLVEPRWYSDDIVEIHRTRNAAIAEAATELIAISEFSKREYLRFHPIDPARIHVAHIGVRSHFTRAPCARADAVASAFGLARPFLVYVGTREPRKNLRGLIEIFARVAESDSKLSLALVGMRPWLEAASVHGADRWDGRNIEARIADLGLTHRVRTLGSVPEDALIGLYSAAEALLFPSLYEGFGIPAIEAMACGLPVIAASRGALPEIVGDAGVLADPTDVDRFAAETLRVLEDASLRDEYRRRGLERAGRYTWQASALATRAVYYRAAGRH
jgi:glycosyltransferase involved in cell wall biosynthesis